MKTLKAYLFFFLIVFCSCESRNEGIKTNWKYIDGSHFGDILNFETEKIEIHGDTLISNSIPVAIIEKYERVFFPGTKSKLTLKNLETGQLGLYTDKGK